MSNSEISKLIDLIKKIENEQKKKKPKLNEIDKLKPIVKGMKQIIKMSYSEYENFKEYLKRVADLLFFITAGYNDDVYVLAVFRKSVQLDYPRIRCYKGFSSYWENITWLWKQCTYIDSYGFIPGEELRKYEVTADSILNLDDDEARTTLSLKQYKIYRKLKSKERVPFSN